MYSDVEAQGLEIDSLLQELRNALKQVKSFNAADRTSRLQACARIAQQIRTCKEAFVLELRALPPEEMQTHKAALVERMNIFKQLLHEYEAKKSEISRDQLMSEAPVFDPEADPDNMTQQQMVEYGDDLQDKTQEALTRMAGMVDESEQIGKATVEKMDEQTAQMKGIQTDMQDVQASIDRAKGTMKSISKGAATDICIIVEVICILVFLTIIIILFAV
eukprot:Selendium_serpulae@DN5426_c0_g1_i1.p2